MVNLLIGLIGTCKYGDIYSITGFRLFMIDRKFVKDITIEEYLNSNLYVAGLSEIDKRVLEGNVTYNYKTLRITSELRPLVQNIGKLPVYENNSLITVDTNNSFESLDYIEYKLRTDDSRLGELRLVYNITNRNYKLFYNSYNIITGEVIERYRYNLYCYCYKLYSYLVNKKAVKVSLDANLLIYDNIADYVGSSGHLNYIELPKKNVVFNLNCNNIDDTLEAIILPLSVKAIKLQGDLGNIKNVRFYIDKKTDISTLVDFAFNIIHTLGTEGYCKSLPKLCKLYGEDKFKHRVRDLRAKLTKYRTTGIIYDNSVKTFIKRLQGIGFNVELIE